MHILASIFGDFVSAKPAKPPKPNAVQKHQAKELAEAKMLLAQAESAEEFYRHQAELFRERIERIEGHEMSVAVGGSA